MEYLLIKQKFMDFKINFTNKAKQRKFAKFVGAKALENNMSDLNLIPQKNKSRWQH